MNWKRANLIAISLLMGVVFFASLLFVVRGDFFVSPDENAAFAFAKQWAETGSFVLSEPLNQELAGLLHPRSAVGWGAGIVPVSFLGFFVLTGLIGALFGSSAMFLVTPIIAVLAVIAWRQAIFNIFQDKALANLAAFFLALHPAFWYYGGRVMMHNISFLAFLLFAFWLASRPKRQLFLAGACLGMAIFIRTSEVTWILPVALTLIIAAKIRIMPMLAGLTVVILIMLAQNQATFGDPFTFGYIARFAGYEASAVTAEISALPNETVATWSHPLLPFGFHEFNILSNVNDYIFKLYPWMTVPAVVGVVVWLWGSDRRNRVWQIAFAATVFVSIVLITVYGSWMILDNPDPSIISLGNSHVRYWLPIFTAASLFAAYAFRHFINERRYLAYLSLGLLALLSANLVFFGHDGFVQNRQALETFVQKREAIVGATESDAVIVVDRADKYVFPYRRVIVPLRSQATYAALPFILEQAPLYYFGITLPEQDLNYLNEVKLVEDNLQIELVLTVQEESLYAITRRP